MPASNNAKYATVASHLLESISSGHYPVGNLLPTELQLAQDYAVSRQTIREALRHLTLMGLLVRQAGVGTRVRRRHSVSRYTHSVDSLFGLDDYANSLHLEVDSVSDIVANGQLASLIGCRVGSHWIRVCGRRFSQTMNEPVAFSENYVHSGFAGLRNHISELKSSTIHAVLEREYGETIEEVSQQIGAIPLDAALSELLAVEAGSPGLEIRRRFFGKGNRLVLSGRAVHVASRFCYESHFVREDGGAIAGT